MPGQGWQGPGPASPPCSLTTTPLCAQNESLHSIIYTVFANDSDTGNASRVSYGIEEVSTEHCGVGHTINKPHPWATPVLLRCWETGPGQTHISGDAGRFWARTHWAMGARC